MSISPSCETSHVYLLVCPRTLHRCSMRKLHRLIRNRFPSSCLRSVPSDHQRCAPECLMRRENPPTFRQPVWKKCTLEDHLFGRVLSLPIQIVSRINLHYQLSFLLLLPRPPPFPNRMMVRSDFRPRKKRPCKMSVKSFGWTHRDSVMPFTRLVPENLVLASVWPLTPCYNHGLPCCIS